MKKRDEKRRELAVRLGVADVSDILTSAEAGTLVQKETGISPRALEEQREGKANAARPRSYKTTSAPTGGLIFYLRHDIDGYIARLNGNRYVEYPQGQAEWPSPPENKPFDFAAFQGAVEAWRLEESRRRYGRALNDPDATYEEFREEWLLLMDAAHGRHREPEDRHVQRLTFGFADRSMPGVLHLDHPALPKAREIVRTVWQGMVEAEKGWRAGDLSELPG